MTGGLLAVVAWETLAGALELTATVGGFVAAAAVLLDSFIAEKPGNQQSRETWY